MGSGASRAARLWARADVRNRWRSLVALGLLAGLTGGLVLATLAGALRSGTALERERDRTNASDAIVFASQVGASHPGWTKLEHRPEVKSLAPWALVFGRLAGDPEGLLFTAVDHRWLQGQDAPIVVAGRMFDPASDTEIVLDDGFASKEGIHVGDTFPFIPYTPQENVGSQSTPGADAKLAGPHLTLHVVGLVRTPMAPLFVSDGLAMAPPGLIDRHPDIDFHENAMVQLRDPAKDLPRLEADASRYVAEGAPVLDLNSTARRVTASTDVERAALGLLAIVIALAGAVLIGQVVIRSGSTVGRDAPGLSAIGLRRGAIAGAATLAHVPALVTTAVTAIATVVITSRWLPIGQASRVEPDRGIRFDPEIALPGTILLLVAMVGALYLTAWLVAGRPRAAGIEPQRGMTEWVRRHASAPVGIGITMALRTGRGARRLPVRSALLGATVGVLGVTGALTLDHGLRDALAHPERAGVAWDAQMGPGQEDAFTESGFSDAFLQAVDKTPGVSDRAQVDRASIPVDAGKGVPSFTVRPVQGDKATGISLVRLSGRAPARAGEAAIGPATAKGLGAHVGDTLKIGDKGRTVKIVGTALFPSDVHAEFDEGLWLVPADFDPVAPGDESSERYLVVRFQPGRSSAGLAALQQTGERFQGGGGPAEVPPELANLRGVRLLPRLLAGLLAVLALAALLQVLMSTTRLRAPEFAVLRAIGFTRRSTRLVLDVQAAAVFAVGLALGIPLGIAVGRVGWSLIAERVPLEEVNPFAAAAIALVVPVALVVAQVVALAPGWRVSRLRTAEVLRTE